MVRTRVLAVVLTAIVAFGNLSAEAAPAAVTVRYAAGSNWPIGPYQWKATVATCPAGFKAVGGGEDNNSGGAVVLQSSEPLADGSGWRIAIRNTGGAELTYRAWAMCASGLTSYSLERSSAVSVPGYSTRYISSACNASPQAMLGFGFHTDDNARVGAAVGHTYNWSAYYFQATTKITNADANPVTASTVTVCGGGYVLGDVAGAKAVARAGEAVAVTATCPVGSILVGGGTASQEPDGYPDPPGWYNEIVSSQPLPITSTSAAAWRTTLYNKATDSQIVQAQALCANP